MAFIKAMTDSSPVTIYSDGSFEHVDVTLRDAMSTMRVEQTSSFGRLLYILYFA
jgi:hypothetical protein